MHEQTLTRWQHDHVFGFDRVKPAERRTRVVALVTVACMCVELVVGWTSGSMALFADGLHMGSHATALGIAAFAYAWARKHANDPRFAFGTGKVGALAGFTGAVLLGLFAVAMAVQSIERFVHPRVVQFDVAMLVAAFGLLVNLGCAVALAGAGRDHDEHHAGGAGYTHEHEHEHVHDHDHGHHHDLNLRSAYLHVLADALTSVLAIGALAGGRWLDAAWLDPAVALVGAALVGRWSIGLARASAGVLLDRQAPEAVRERIRAALERDGTDRIVDLHVWSVGPGTFAAEIGLVGNRQRVPEDVKRDLPRDIGLVHVTVECHLCPEHATPEAATAS